jgi:hypothetical protein
MARLIYTSGLAGLMDLWMPNKGKLLSNIKFKSYKWAGAASYPAGKLPDRYPLYVELDKGMGHWEHLIPMPYLYPLLSAVVLRLNLGGIVYASIAFYNCDWLGVGTGTTDKGRLSFQYHLTSREQPGRTAWLKVETEGPAKASVSGKQVLIDDGKGLGL